ncbi:CRISPR-associated helicase Cas3' [Tumebacillus sp. BK434]|uniref:CRISPR-associated helicase Cas3' n=1 Tax=Tumebacillus sp. BK434 TaxID=2512169 RepID=UPI00140545A0|nr:CRISPR-associated helicase Cas3' [Tumebacillus sp. BK434]
MDIGFQEFFQETFGNKPYPYQVQVAEQVLLDKNMVLVAPTGAGKTYAALAPFLYSKKIGKPVADRVIYALPLRALASSLHQSTEEIVKEKLGLDVTLQMGNQPDDPYFQGDIVFTTIDQLLSAYVGLAFGTSAPASNIPPGALIGAQVIIDEFHLLSYQEALLTFLEMMKRLKHFTQFFVMTATAPSEIVDRISLHLNTTPIRLSNMNQLNRTRSLQWHEEPLSVDAILKSRGDKTLVVINTVDRAQQLYLELQSRLVDEGMHLPVRCLHSRMFEKDRQDTEKWVHERFYKKAKAPAILVATQVVEVGLDISADVLITDLCPANALLQRAGRCARYEEEIGKIHVFSLVDAEGERLPSPYDVERLCLTEEFLISNVPSQMTPEFEQSIVEYVHGTLDVKELNEAFLDLPARADVIEQSLVSGEGNVQELVRLIDNVSVLVHNAPESLRLENKPERVSISTFRLYKLIKQELEKVKEYDIGWYPIFEKSQSKGLEVTWAPIRSERDIRGCSLVCLSPQIVNYQKDVGLLLPPFSGNRKCLMSKEQKTDHARANQPFRYVRETYLEHVERIRSLFQHEEQLHMFRVANDKLSKQLRGQDGQLLIAYVAELVGALHDVGKLTKKYQIAVRKWQVQYRNKDESDLLAHTDYDGLNPADRKESKKKMYERGNHAVEGALMSLPIFDETALRFDGQAQEHAYFAMVLAIMRHHNAFSENYKEFSIAKRAEEIVGKSLSGLFDGGVQLNHEAEDLSSYKNRLIKPDVLALYWYLVRRVRLNDQLSQRLLHEGKEDQNGARITVDSV